MKNTCSRTYSCIFLLLFAFSCQLSLGQLTQPARYEKEFKYSDGYFTIISMKEEGLFLIRSKDKYHDGKKIWEVTILDKDLKEKRTLELYVESRNQFVGYEYVPGKMYVLYRMGDTNRNDLEAIELDLVTYGTSHYIIKPELALQLSHFTIAGDNLLLGGYVNREPTILLYETASSGIKVLPGFFQKDIELVDLKVNQNNTFNAVLIDRDSRTQNKVIFRTYDPSGKILLEDEVAIKNNQALQTGITSTLEREDLMVLGNWGERNSKQSSGFFALPVDPFNDQDIQYLHFGEMEHYLDYLNLKRAKRIKSRSLEEIKAGKTPNYINYVMPYRIQEFPSGYLLLAEVYQPSSNFFNYPYPYNPYYPGPYDLPYGYYPGMRRFYPYSQYGNPRNTQEIKTYESVVLAFNPQGKLLWDYSLKLDETKLPSIEQVSDFHYFNSQMIILYKNESELKGNWITTDIPEIEEITEKIKLTHEEDEVRSENDGDGGVRYWCNNSFYVWGYHTIRNNNMKDRVREVFYINKVVAN